MRLVFFETQTLSSFGCMTDEGIVDLGARRLGAGLTPIEIVRNSAWDSCERACIGCGVDFYIDEVRLMPPCVSLGRIICVGLNCPSRSPTTEAASDMAPRPSVFVRFASSFVGHDQAIERPAVSEQLDVEGELALLIGREGRRIPRNRAMEFIAGYTVANDGTVRDWMRHSRLNVTQGKNFDKSGSMGPWIVPAREIDLNHGLTVSTRVNDAVLQSGSTASLIWDIPAILAYLSEFTTLHPGDLILTGSPCARADVSMRPRWLRDGDVIEIEISQVGTLRNRVVDEPAVPGIVACHATI